MTVKPIRTCVLGVGLAGLTFHVPYLIALPELFTLHAVLERNPKFAGGKVHERFGVTINIHRTIGDVVNDQDIELIIVATPNETHYALAKAALQAGKHVLVDKPVTSTVQEAEELGALAKSKHLVLYAFQNRRWDQDYLALCRLLALPDTSPQSLGMLLEFESVFDRFRPSFKGTWKDEPLPANGQTFDLGAHLVDQALQLFGRPQKLTALMQNVRGIGHPEVEDTFTLLMHYPANSSRKYPLTVDLRAHILSVRCPQPRYIVRGTKGTLTKFGVDVQEEQLKAMTSPLDDEFGREPEDRWGTVENIEADGVSVGKSIWPSTDPGSQIDLFRNLASAIRNGSELAVKWEEATEVIEIIQLAHSSAREGKTVIVPRK